MNEFKHLDKLILLESRIRQQGTGSPKDLAKRLNVCSGTIIYMINKLRAFGAEIKFCRTRNSYYYSGDNAVKLSYSVELEPLTGMTYEEMKNISGGGKVFSFFPFQLNHF